MQMCPVLQTMDCKFSVSCVHGFSRQEHWSGQPFPSPGDLPTQGSSPGLLQREQFLYCLSTREVGVSLHFLDTILFSDMHGVNIVSHTVNSLSMYLSFLILRSSFLDLFFFLEVHPLCSFVLRSQLIVSPPCFCILVKVSLFLL